MKEHPAALHFANLEDPRIDRTKLHKLLDILVIAICAAICGADNWEKVALFGRAKEAWFKTFLELPNGIPSHDTFWRVFAKLDPQQFQQSFYGNMIGESGWEQLTLEEMQAAVHEAHKAGRPVTAHAHHPQSIKNAVQAGVDSIEHCHYADEEGIQMMKDNNVAMVPTLAIAETLMEKGTQFGFGPHMEVNARMAVKKGEESVKMALAAGLRIAAGTDPVRQDTMLRECECLYRAGLSPMEVIVAATQVGAELVRAQDSLGTLESGKIADLIILDGNPLDDIKALGRVEWVVKGGKVYKSPQ